jgi:DNA-binding GntR family transcriptional regulator
MRACQRLIGEGFLETNARRTVVVAPLTDARVVEEFSMLDHLESLAVRTAAAAETRARTAARWQRINQSMAQHIKEETPDACAAANLAFHTAIWDSLRSPYVRNLVALVWDHLEPARQLATVDRPWDRTTSVAEHQAIVDAVAQGDPDAAEAAVRAHRRNHVTRVRAALQRANA